MKTEGNARRGRVEFPRGFCSLIGNGPDYKRDTSEVQGNANKGI